MPAWAQSKGIRGLNGSADSLWTGRITATKLMRLDTEAGGSPKLTTSPYRRCGVCGRVLLGVMAEARFELDRKFEGHRTPCGPECVEVETLKRKKAA